MTDRTPEQQHPQSTPEGDRTPTGDLREQLAEALTREHYRRASERIEAPPEEHCAGFADAVLPVVEAETADLRERAEQAEAALAEQAQTLRAVEIDRDEWRDRAHHWQATAGPPEDSDEYDLDTDPDALRRNLNEVIEFLEGRPAKMVHDAVWARVRPVLRIFREKLTEQRTRAEQARLAAEDLRAHVGPSHVVTPYVLRVLHALEQSEEAPTGQERAAPVDWEATARQRERELRQVGEARHQAEAAVQRIHAFAVSIQEPGAPLFWPEGGRRIQQELDDHGAGSGRCPSCDHPVSLHQPDGCWFAVEVGTVGRDLVCPCSVPRAALDQPEET